MAKPTHLTCSRCKKEKSTNDFYVRRCKASLRGYRAKCKDCEKELALAWAKDLTYEQRKDKHLKHLYGIRLVDYQRMYDEQGGGCAICTDQHDVLQVDHNHETGHVRGLLCYSCNTGLGHMKDNSLILMAASRYLYE